MVTDIRPPGVKTAKKSKIWIASVAPANPASVKVSELTAALAIECYLLPGGWAMTPTDEIDTDQRYCDDQVPGTFGATTWQIASLTYLYDPQGDGTEEGNLAFGALTKGSQVWAYVRDGLDIDTTPAAGQVLTAVAPVECGTQGSTPVAAQSSGGGQVSMFTITQALQVSGPVEQFVTVAAS